mmetsp:Transcript_25040/g.49869  ORF Transcript_25040/g.49869 Transcript_25040/m.49869 type:complete len:212 (+) Transcript_25040:801-1436(+)
MKTTTACSRPHPSPLPPKRTRGTLTSPSQSSTRCSAMTRATTTSSSARPLRQPPRLPPPRPRGGYSATTTATLRTIYSARHPLRPQPRLRLRRRLQRDCSGTATETTTTTMTASFPRRQPQLPLRLRLRLRLQLLLRRHRPGSFQTMETTTMETILYSGPPHLPLLQLLHPRPPSSLTTETTTTTMTLCSVLPRPLRPLLRPPLRRRLPRL